MTSYRINNLLDPSSTQDAATKSYVDTSIPVGGIIMWSGTIAAIPSNWRLCNGSNGTPDLTNKFVICANVDASTTGTGGSSGVTRAHTNIEGSNLLTGGSKDAVVVTHSHTASSDSKGAHTHPVTAEGSYFTIAAQSNPFNDYYKYAGSLNGEIKASTLTATSAGEHTHTITVNDNGVSGSNKRLPPYYALAFIMRIS
jgi:hypothetical protein